MTRWRVRNDLVTEMAVVLVGFGGVEWEVTIGKGFDELKRGYVMKQGLESYGRRYGGMTYKKQFVINEWRDHGLWTHTREGNKVVRATCTVCWHMRLYTRYLRELTTRIKSREISFCSSLSFAALN